MNNFTDLAKVLKKIDATSKKIIDEALKVMKELQSEDTELIDDLIDAKSLKDQDRAFLLEMLQSASMGWTDDAEKVKQEIGNFILCSDGPETIFSVNTESGQCPFLTEVWSGDEYDLTEIDGMKALLADLELQLKMISGEKLVERVANTQIFP